MRSVILAAAALFATPGFATPGPADENPPAAQSSNNKLPSGSSDEFRRQMLGWRTPAEEPDLRLRNGPADRVTANLDRLAISSGFGWRTDPIEGTMRRHDGIDLPGRMGSRVLATGAGIVRIAGWVRGYGNLVEIQHPGGVTTRYGHLERIRVHPSERVEQGELIGDLGSTGRSTGPHLHYEIRVDGVPVDPRRFAGTEPTYDTVWAAKAPNPQEKWTGWDSPRFGESLPEARIQ